MRGHALLPTPLVGEHQSFATGAASARTANPVTDQTRHVVLFCTESCHYAFGDGTVTATTADTFLPGGVEHFVRISPGQSIAAIQDTAAGTFHVSEFAG